MIKYGNNNIGKIFFGGNTIGKAYLGSNLVYDSGSGPQPITNVAYIRGGADGSYIDTGITADNTVKVIVWARNFNPTSGNLFGSRVGTTQDTFGIGSHGNAATGDIRVDYAQSNSTYARNQFENLSHYHKYEFYGGVLKVDDVIVATATTGAFSNQYNIHLFGLNNNGTHANMALPADICTCKIYKNSVLVRDYSAVNSPSVGLYDAVSNTVFTNVGNGSFIYGTFNTDAYIPLKYIEGTNAQYFDTGLYGNKTLPVVAKFRVIGTGISNPNVFGTMVAGTNGSYFLLQLSNSSYPNSNLIAYINVSTSNNLYNNTSSRLTGRDIVFVKNSTTVTAYENNAQLGTQRTFDTGTFTTPYTIYVSGVNLSGSAHTNKFNGLLYYIGFGADKNFVPAKVNNIAGMYDTYNDVFYPSATETAFIAGTTL